MQPILEKLNVNKKRLEADQAIVRKLQNEQNEAERFLESLRKEYEECLLKKEETLQNLEANKLKLFRAKKLITGLFEEAENWKYEIKKLLAVRTKAFGNVLISSAILA